MIALVKHLIKHLLLISFDIEIPGSIVDAAIGNFVIEARKQLMGNTLRMRWLVFRNNGHQEFVKFLQSLAHNRNRSILPTWKSSKSSGTGRLQRSQNPLYQLELTDAAGLETG